LLNRMVGHPARLALPLLTLLVCTPPVAAQQPTVEPQQREHVVRRGDTLWDLARQYLSNPFLWPMIFEANRDVVRNPHWIYPADRLIIPPVLQQPPFQQPGDIGRPPLPQMEPEGVALPVEEATPTTLTTLDFRRPVVTAAEYVRLPWLSAAADPGVSGRILRRADSGQQEGRIPSALYPNDRVHLTMSGRAAAGDTVLVIRTGRRIGTHGSVVEPVALVRLDSVWTGTVLGQVVAQFGEARVGDMVMPLQPLPPVSADEPEVVTGGMEGRILEFVTRASMHGPTDLAFISLGAVQGVGIGDEFAVYEPVRGSMPSTQVGVLRVVRVGEGTATARVLSVTGTAMRDGLPLRLVRRMP
jgi:hypothetical protein